MMENVITDEEIQTHKIYAIVVDIVKLFVMKFHLQKTKQKRKLSLIIADLYLILV
jgi:hypothetical protein